MIATGIDKAVDLDARGGTSETMTQSDPSTPALLETSGLVCGYTGREVVRSADVALRPSGCLAVVGPNGAGKTTLLRTLSGFIPPISGRVLLDGAPVHGLGADERAQRIAVLPQEGRLDPDLKVRELVAIGRTPFLGAWGRMGRRDEEVVEETLSRLDLGALADRKLGEISGGERQRARLAMVLAQQAPLVLLDEPAAHLDLKRRYELSCLLGRLREDMGLAFVVIAHDLKGILDLAREVLVVHDGVSDLWSSADEDSLRDVVAAAFDVPASWVDPLRLAKG